MADREVRYVIRAIDATRAGVNAAIRGLGAVARAGVAAGRRVMRAFANVGSFIFRQFRRAALGAAAFGVLVIRAAIKQEDALMQLSAALRNNGDNVEELMPKYQRFASSMQKVTVFGDEQILAQMAYARNLGVTADKLEAAATAAAGLAAKFRIDLQTAMMLVGRASQGQTQMLTRYGIVLDENLKPQEKFNKLLEIGAEAFKLAKAETETTSGALAQFKNTFGDLLEVIGQGLIEGFKLVPLFQDLTTSVRGWITALQESEAVEKWATTARTAVSSVIELFERISMGGIIGAEAFKDLGRIIVAAFKDAGNAIIGILQKHAVPIGLSMAEAFASGLPARYQKAAMESIERARRMHAAKQRRDRWTPEGPGELETIFAELAARPTTRLSPFITPDGLPSGVFPGDDREATVEPPPPPTRTGIPGFLGTVPFLPGDIAQVSRTPQHVIVDNASDMKDEIR